MARTRGLSSAVGGGSREGARGAGNEDEDADEDADQEKEVTEQRRRRRRGRRERRGAERLVIYHATPRI